MTVVMALVLFAGNAGQGRTQRPSESHLFFLHFSRTIDTRSLSISYFLYGPFGGYGSFVRTQANTWDYAMETSYENKPARRLKAIIFCPGYETKLLEIASLDDSLVMSPDIELTPLPKIPLSGKVVPAEPTGAAGLLIEATYMADWGQEFFEVSDGFVTSFNVASAKVSEDGSFSMMVPDFGHDSSIRPFKDHGSIRLTAREPETGNMVYRLERSNSPGRDAELPIAEEYSELNLYARSN